MNSNHDVSEAKSCAETLSAQCSEPSIFLPYGRIGRVSYGFRWSAVLSGFCLVGWLDAVTVGSGLGALIRGSIYPLFAFMLITSIKRLHDIGYSAWAVILLGPIVPLLLLLPGEPNTNSYGDPPSTPIL